MVMTINNPETGPAMGKAAMYIEANVHGNEIQGSEVVVYTAWYLMENYDRIPEIRKLVDERVFYLIPTVNPDGRDYFLHGTGSGSHQNNGFSPSALLERLSMVEAQTVAAIASEPEPPVLSLGFCVRELRRGRYERERAAVQREIAELQRRGGASEVDIDALLARKGDLGRRIQALAKAED
jgi:hypothetical protein